MNFAAVLLAIVLSALTAVRSFFVSVAEQYKLETSAAISVVAAVVFAASFDRYLIVAAAIAVGAVGFKWGKTGLP